MLIKQHLGVSYGFPIKGTNWRRHKYHLSSLVPLTTSEQQATLVY